MLLEVLTWDVYSAPRQTSKLEGLARIWNASNDDASKFQKGKKIVILYWTFCSQCNYNYWKKEIKYNCEEKNLSKHYETQLMLVNKEFELTFFYS